jgi:hypothetical protein
MEVVHLLERRRPRHRGYGAPRRNVECRGAEAMEYLLDRRRPTIGAIEYLLDRRRSTTGAIEYLLDRRRSTTGTAKRGVRE